MNGQNTVRMSYGNLLTTLALAAAGFWWLSGVANATSANAAEIQHQKELQQQENKHIREQLDDIKDLLKEMKKED